MRGRQMDQSKAWGRPLICTAILAAIALVLWATLRQPSAAIEYSSAPSATRTDGYYAALSSEEVEALAPPGQAREDVLRWEAVHADLAARVAAISHSVRPYDTLTLMICHVMLVLTRWRSLVEPASRMRVGCGLCDQACNHP